MIYPNSDIRIADISDGTSHTYMAGETKYCLLKIGCKAYFDSIGGALNDYSYSWASNAAGHTTSQIPQQGGIAAAVDPINNPAVLFTDIDEFDPAIWVNYAVPARAFSSNHPGGCHMMMADASVHFVDENIDLHIHQDRGDREDGFPIGDLSSQ